MTYQGALCPAKDTRPFFLDALDSSFRETGLEKQIILSQGYEAEEAVKCYIVDMLTEFIRTEKLSPSKTVLGRPVELRYITDVLGFVQATPVVFDKLWGYEHIGKRCVFTAGIFPESLGTRRNLHNQGDYEQIAETSFARAALIQRVLYREAFNPAFGIIASNIKPIVGMLNYARENYFAIENWLDRLIRKLEDDFEFKAQ